MRTSLLAFLLLAASSLFPAQAAVELQKLYQAQVAVTSQNADERSAAAREAFTRTLLKVSGDDTVLEHASVQLAMQNVRNFVVQYGYQQRDDELFLWVQFDQPQIDRIIQAAGSGIWSHLRPELLFWIVAEDESLQRRLLGSGDSGELVPEVYRAAELRGLPIKLPLLDLNDTMSLSVLDVWARFDDRIDFASSRYDTDGVVVARVFQSDRAVTAEPWTLDWTLKLGELRWRGTVTGEAPERLAKGMVADITQQLAQRYRIGASAEMAGKWRIKITDITTFMDVLNAEQLLLALPSVTRVQLAEYGQHQAQFELSIQTDPAQIMQAVDISKQFQPVNTEQRSEFETPVYRWNKS